MLRIAIVPRIAIVIILGLLCESLVAQAPSAEPSEDQAVESAADQAAQVEAEPTNPPTEDATPAETAEPTVIVEKVYRIFSAQSDQDTEIGTLTITAVETEQSLLITGEMSCYVDSQDGPMVRLVTSVDYDLAWTQPVSGQAETSVDGTTFMAGTVEFGETTYSYAGVELLDDRTAEPLVTPVEFGQADLPRPAGPVVVLQDFPVVAPRLVPEGVWAGGLVVAIVDFTASTSVGELMKIEYEGVLVRDYPDDEGNVKFSLLGPSYTYVTGSDGVIERRPRLELWSTVTYDANGEIVDYFVHRSWRLVEADDAETPEESDE